MDRTMRAMGMVKVFLLVGLLAVTTACGGSESRKAKHVEQGKEFMAERNYTKARLEFRNALQIDPKDAQVRALAGLAAEKLGEYEEAVKMYRVAIATDEALVLPRARLARLLVLGGLPDEAMELISPALPENPRSADLLSVRALVLAAEGDLIAARKDSEAAVASEPGNFDAVSALAGLIWREGKPDEAVALLRKSVTSNPNEIELRLLLGRILLEMDKPAEAEAEFAEVVRIDPASVQHRYQLAQVYLSQGKDEQAVATLREAVRTAPTDLDAKIALLQVLAASGSLKEAEKEAAKLRTDAPKDYALALGIAQFYDSSGIQDKAEIIYREIIEKGGGTPAAQTARSRLASQIIRAAKFDEAASLVNAVLDENPADAQALAVRAEIALQRGDAESAISDLRVAFSNQPDSVELAAALARAYVQAGQRDLAEQTLRSVVQTSPGNMQARFALAQFLAETGKASQAHSVLEQLVAEQPNNFLALEGLAQLQFRGQDLDGARKSVATIRTLLPNSARGFVLAGQIEQSENRFSDARRLYEQAASVDPKAPEPVMALVRLDLAEKQPERALARLNDSLRAMPDNAILLVVRGDLLMGMARSEEAATSYAAAVEARPNWTQAYRSLARAYSAAAQDPIAVATLEKGLVATGNSPWIALDLARLHERLGQIDAAIAAYEAMLRRNPRDKAAANNLAMLLVTHNNDSKSLERASALVENFSDSDVPGLMDTYGWVMFKRGEYATAVEVLQRALEKAPRASEIRYHLGMAQIKSGDADEGRRNLELAVANDSTFPGVDDARAVLGTM